MSNNENIKADLLTILGIAIFFAVILGAILYEDGRTGFLLRLAQQLF